MLRSADFSVRTLLLLGLHAASSAFSENDVERGVCLSWLRKGWEGKKKKEHFGVGPRM